MNQTATEQHILQQLRAGVAAHTRGNLPAAENAYKAVLSLDQANATAHNNLGFVYGQQGQWRPALEHLQAALHINPAYATALSNIGQIYFSTGEREKAFEFLEKAVAMDDRDAQNWHNLARLCLLAGNFQRAEYAWWRAHNLRPEYLDYAVNLGISVAAQHRFDDAANIYDTVLARNPMHFNALLQAGICRLLMKNYGDAQQLFLRARQINAGDASLLRHLGLVELTLGNKLEAAHYFKTLLEITPDDEAAHLDYALVLLDQEEWAALEQQRDWLQAIAVPAARTQHYLLLINNELSARAIH